MIVTNTFKMPVDASLYSFNWKGAEEVEVTYNAKKIDNGQIVVAPDIKAPMYLLGMIVLSGKWEEFRKEVENAAIHNATPLLNNQHVDETMLQAIAPFI
jgi:hypothetical protein